MRWRNHRRTAGLRVASGALALGGLLALGRAAAVDLVLPYGVAAIVAAGLALHRAELEHRFPRVAETVAFSVVLAALFGAAAAVLAGQAGQALSELLYGLWPGFVLGLVAGLLVYALTPAGWVQRTWFEVPADRESARGG